jgi:transketolase
MRRQFAKYLCESAERDPTLILLVGDIGFGVFEDFRSSFPDRYLNVGIAEQNSIGVMSGLSKEGLFPIFFTIIPFLLYRPLEFIRNDLLVNQRSGLLVGVGAGLSYGPLGPTHHATEDLSVCQALPSLTVLSPSTVESMNCSLEQVFRRKSGISYLRLGKREEVSLNLNKTNTAAGLQFVGNSNSFLRVSKLLIVSYGDTALGVIETLSGYIEKGVISIVVIEQLQPLPEKKLLEYILNAEKVLVVEEQLNGSGIYNVLCEIIVRNGLNVGIAVANLGNSYIERVGNSRELLEEKSLYGKKLIERVEDLI